MLCKVAADAAAEARSRAHTAETEETRRRKEQARLAIAGKEMGAREAVARADRMNARREHGAAQKAERALEVSRRWATTADAKKAAAEAAWLKEHSVAMNIA